jgi:SAM-dependent methyltransferase
VLDLGGLNESNVNFLSSLGCKIHALDLLGLFDRYKAGLPGRRFQPDHAREFVEEYLGFPPEHLDAILVWDVLEYFDPEVLDLDVSRLGQVLRPGGILLAFFHTQVRGEVVSVNQYEIEDTETLCLKPLRVRPLPASFNNRSLERLFGGFRSVKFFLRRDSLREVIVVR